MNINLSRGYVTEIHKEDEAALAYDLKALSLYGEFAKLNFPIKVSRV